MVGEPLQHVADIDHHRALGRVDRQPVAFLGQQLQPRFLGAEQQRDQIDVLMRAGAHLGRVGGNRRIVQQPQHRIAVLDRMIEPVGREPQMPRDRRQQPVARHVERREQVDEGLAKTRGLIGPDVGGHLRREAVALGEFAPDMPEFLEVDMRRALGDLGLERRIAARTATARAEILALGFLGQREERFGHRPGARDQLGRDAVVRDDGKAEALERIAERRREGDRVGGLVGKRERRDLGNWGVEHGVVRYSGKPLDSAKPRASR